ncbi:choice-of-anchor D domain-containing protein, partial [Candidatus Sumerlaeota bacterium]|nr:choice-of-anchor D domain-containing protein [Candidatus Sumerlaeota bacterium]
TFDFGGHTLDAGPALKMMTISNPGTGDLRITSATIVNAAGGVDDDSRAFTFHTPLPLTVPPGETRQAQLRFTPPALGLTQAWLRVYSNDYDAYSGEGEDRVPAQVQLEGTGVASRIVMAHVDSSSGATVPLPSDGSPVDFGLATYDRPAAEHTFVASNVSAASVTLGSLSITSPFAAGADGLASPLASNTSDTFTLLLPTTAVGSFSGQVTLPIDGQEYPYIFYVSGEVLYPAPYWALH